MLASTLDGWSRAAVPVTACFCFAVHITVLFKEDVLRSVGSGNAKLATAMQGAALNNDVVCISRNLDLAAAGHAGVL